MSSFYERKRAKATTQLKKRGFALTFKLPVQTYDEVTGAVTEGSPKKYTEYGLFMDDVLMRTNPLDKAKDTMIEAQSRNLMVSASNLPETPGIEYLVEIDGVDHAIKDVKPFAPGNVVIFYEVTIED